MLQIRSWKIQLSPRSNTQMSPQVTSGKPGALREATTFATPHRSIMCLAPVPAREALAGRIADWARQIASCWRRRNQNSLERPPTSLDPCGSTCPNVLP